MDFTALAIRNAQPQAETCKLGDVRSRYVLLMSNSAKYWRLASRPGPGSEEKALADLLETARGPVKEPAIEVVGLPHPCIPNGQQAAATLIRPHSFESRSAVLPISAALSIPESGSWRAKVKRIMLL